MTAKTILLALAWAAPGFSQTAPPEPPAPPLASIYAEDAAAYAEDAAGYIAQAKIDAARAKIDIDIQGLDGLRELKGSLAMLQNPTPMPPMPPIGPKARTLGAPDVQYDSATRLLDEHKYDEAIPRFDRVIAAKTDRADGALYWKAYALNRIGRRDEALASLAALRRDYPASHWLNDAQVLEAEVKQSAGKPVSPVDESNEDIKLMAINSLMRADPDRAVPLLENLLKSGSSPRLKDRALFVLTQSRSPKAEQILTDYAKGAGNPDLQIRAIRYIGASGSADSQQQLVSIYTASNDTATKREILRSLMAAGAKDQLYNLAKNEKDPSLRVEAIRQLSTVRGGSESLAGLYSADADQKIKRELVNGLFSRGDAKALVDIARKEPDPTMKKHIVELLSTMRNNKEATDYMMELLK